MVVLAASQELERPEVPILLQKVDPELLSQEWRDSAYLLDRPRITGSTPIIDSYPALVEYSVKSTEWADRFCTFGDYPDPHVDPEGYSRVIQEHNRYYYALAGIHGINGREEGFLRYLHHLRTYNEIIGEKRHILRLEASVSEDLGMHLNDEELLMRSMLLNRSIYNNPNISFVKPYKIHSAFSGFDIASAHAGNRELLEKLGLAWDEPEQQVQFYTTLGSVLKRARHDLAKSNGDYGGDLGSIVGAGTELAVLGIFRGTLIETGLSDEVYISQATVSEDSSQQLPTEAVEGRIPISAYDMKIIQRIGGSRLKIAIRKGINDTGGSGQMPDIIRVRFKPEGGYSTDGAPVERLDLDATLDLLIAYADAKLLYWYGETLCDEQVQLIELFENRKNINLHTTKQRYEQQTGETIDWLDLKAA